MQSIFYFIVYEKFLVVLKTENALERLIFAKLSNVRGLDGTTFKPIVNKI